MRKKTSIPPKVVNLNEIFFYLKFISECKKAVDRLSQITEQNPANVIFQTVSSELFRGNSYSDFLWGSK